ncbi:phosphatase PAP2 family protein [Hymenobacter aerilatus]|uniref:Phosphatase PAP2 family protein n=1 Tax=Hymenobacter aerilatus TaxID=2932251 RepID=A0A8T9STP4_9BACT|nr:phosphatase PAP2 family protein [Hymenobacter aerilatus]UOR05532.1 phosphatase PAP2 family protein [Hymenobacter aerilatus]
MRFLLLLLFSLTALPGAYAQTAYSPADSSTAWRPARALRVAVPLTLLAVAYAGKNENVVDEWKEHVRDETREAFPRFHTKIDDYTRRASLWGAYGLMVVGVHGERGAVAFTLNYALAHAVSSTVVSKLKHYTHEQRPDVAGDFSSFPSAHTADAFLTATLLHEQFGKEHPWVSVAGYTVATATGAMRVLNDRHWASDVLAGASIGFLSAEMVWRLYPHLARLVPGKVGGWLTVVPAYAPGQTLGLVAVLRPGSATSQSRR